LFGFCLLAIADAWSTNQVGKPNPDRVTQMICRVVSPRFARLVALIPVAFATTLYAVEAQAPALTGTIIVVNKDVSTATIIDVATAKILVTLPTGKGPHELVLSSDGRTAVVTDYFNPDPACRQTECRGKTLTVIDVPNKKVLRTIDLGEHLAPHGIQFIRGDSLVVVTTEASGHIHLVNVHRGTIVKSIASQGKGTHMVAATADGTRAYTGNIGSNTVSEYDLTKGTLTRTFTVPEQPEAINVTPDGKEVWVGSNKTGKVSVIDPATGTVTTAAEGFKFPYRILFTPDLRTAILPDVMGGEVRFLERATRKELGRLQFPGADPQGVTLTPDGRYLLQSLNKEARIAVIEIATRKIVSYLPAGTAPDGIGYAR
jgi:YVTN family beta-propeller protein